MSVKRTRVSVGVYRKLIHQLHCVIDLITTLTQHRLLHSRRHAL